MKYLMFSLFFISSILLYGQEINMELTFDWPNNTQDDDAFIEEFIASTPNDFQQYKLNERYTPTLSDLFEALHVIDLNNDGLKDVIFDGLSGGEPRLISIYINKGGYFDNVFDEYQQISNMEFNQGILSRLQIKDWDCCAGINETYRLYDVAYVNNKFIFKPIEAYRYLKTTDLPSKYWSETKTVRILNDNYNMRLSPKIDNTTEYYFELKPQLGNIIAQLPKRSIAVALAESIDETGRVWYFVAVPPFIRIRNSRILDFDDEIKSYKCGWISSRYVENID